MPSSSDYVRGNFVNFSHYIYFFRCCFKPSSSDCSHEKHYPFELMCIFFVDFFYVSHFHYISHFYYIFLCFIVLEKQFFWLLLFYYVLFWLFCLFFFVSLSNFIMLLLTFNIDVAVPMELVVGANASVSAIVQFIRSRSTSLPANIMPIDFHKVTKKKPKKLKIWKQKTKKVNFVMEIFCSINIYAD